MDMSLYRDLFVSESRSHLSAFSELIVHLEESPDDPAAIDELFRHAHSMKGMAATMGYDQIVGIAHAMEDLLGRIRSGEFQLFPALTDILLAGSDALARLVSGIESGDELEDTTALLERIVTFDPSDKAHTNPPPALPPQGADKALVTPAVPHQFRRTDSFKSIRIKTETLDQLVNITGELITNRYRMAESIRMADAVECREPLHQLTALLRTLRDEVFKARMLPFSFIADRFPRLVRDLARKQGKEVHFQLEGKEIELDRGILEEITEPIVHILRNAVDHGLETADERVLAGKPFGGTITLAVCRDKDHVEIIISDDGRGMDPELLKLKAVEKGIISSEQASQMVPEEAYQLICKPGFSTAATVTDISGRGVGMDAVREAVHALAGVITIKSQRGLGSRFVMRLPITVSIIHALIVQCGPFEIAFPLTVVKRTLELKRTEIRKESGGSTIISEDHSLRLRSLRHALYLTELPENDDDLLPIVICDVGGILLAFSADSISGQQEIFVRPLRSPLSHLRGFSGATVTGDGRVLFVADASALA
ncbi:MAG: chemotaxis protein CheA [Geobacteraceae bacterium]|nr:chemotaxis protein CheA [Geobacteraceae bacterium]NTW80005.1 chemotaxis protein CheA [Geobacteraceae bacterium]